MTTPAKSAATGKVVSANTRAGYAADWALFTDWCTATHHVGLPADWSTVATFTAGCPGAPGTLRRRLAAIATTTAPPDTPHPPTQPGRPARRRGR